MVKLATYQRNVIAFSMVKLAAYQRNVICLPFIVLLLFKLTAILMRTKPDGASMCTGCVTVIHTYAHPQHTRMHRTHLLQIGDVLLQFAVHQRNEVEVIVCEDATQSEDH